jgi:hypothetical protein
LISLRDCKFAGAAAAAGGSSLPPASRLLLGDNPDARSEHRRMMMATLLILPLCSAEFVVHGFYMIKRVDFQRYRNIHLMPVMTQRKSNDGYICYLLAF